MDVHVDVGFQPDHLATFQIVAPDPRYGQDPQAIALQRRIIGDISNLPGVKSVALSSQLPISGNGSTNWIRIAGRPEPPAKEDTGAGWARVMPGFFETIGAKMIMGRPITDDDTATTRDPTGTEDTEDTLTAHLHLNS